MQPTRFETRPAFLLAGLRQHHAFATAAQSIPAQWKAFAALGDIPGRRGSAAYGAVCQTDVAQQRFEYLCAVEVERFEDVPRELGRMRVPEQRYAVFTHEGHVSGLRQTWEAIWQQWLPGSGLKPAPTPDFELYDARFDAATGRGVVEIWFPVGAAAP